MQLQGIAAIVTGGGSGLGEATATALAAAGARVAVLDINAEAARVVAARIGGVAAACDVGDADSAAAALAIATAAHGPARVLVNCAGIVNPGRIVGRDGPLPLAAYERVIRVNLIGTFNLLRLVGAEAQKLEPLEDGERGVIVNTASVAAYDGQIGQPAYASSKAGVVGLTLPAEAQASLAASIPYPSRLGRPSEYADLVLHIVANRMLNGETIRLDGAIRLAPK